MADKNERLGLRLRVLYLYSIFTEKTDSEHFFTLQQLIDELKKYGISASRKTVYNNIKALRK